MRPTSSPLQHFHKIFKPSINNETYHVKVKCDANVLHRRRQTFLINLLENNCYSFRHISPSNPLARKMKTKCASWVVMTTADTTHDPQSQHTWKSYASRTLTTVVDKHWLVFGSLRPVQVAEMNLWRKSVRLQLHHFNYNRNCKAERSCSTCVGAILPLPSSISVSLQRQSGGAYTNGTSNRSLQNQSRSVQENVFMYTYMYRAFKIKTRPSWLLLYT